MIYKGLRSSSNKGQQNDHDFAPPHGQRNKEATNSIRALLASNEGMSQENDSKHEFESTDQLRDNAMEYMQN